jgi:hypothetical protein
MKHYRLSGAALLATLALASSASAAPIAYFLNR